MEFPEITDISINSNLSDVFLAILAVGLAYGVASLSIFILEALSKRFPARRLFFKRLQPVPQLGSFIVGGYLVIATLGPDQNSLLAILGSMALALGLAAQDLVKDVLGGLVVIIDKPFQIGDRIHVADHYGEVIHIGLRSTKLVTSANALVTVPNSQLLGEAVSNTNAGAVHCLVTTHIFLPPEADLGTIGNIAHEAALTSKASYPGKPITVLFKQADTDDDMTDMEVRAYVFEIRYEEMFVSDLRRRILAALLEKGLISDDFDTETIDERIQSGLADNLLDLGRRFARKDSAESQRMWM
ncbi:MAG: mechanosensitive ion channel family protein [Gammaproteobacteria bacterium]